MFSLDSCEKLLLLGVARRAMIAAVSGRESGAEELPAELSALQCAGAFVTLRQRGRLRGCIGQIGVKQSAADVIAYSARAAALDDPRFLPVRTTELPEIEIELSILSSPEMVRADQIEAGRHGLIVSRGFQRGVLLPQVATEHQWDSRTFLEETCAKAGLDRNAWSDPETQILAFTALVFGEPELVKHSAESHDGLRTDYSSST